MGQGADERDVVEGQALERLGQAKRLPANALQVAAQVDRLGPNQHLEVGQLGVEELGTAGQQLLLLGVVGAGQRLVGAGHVEYRQPVGTRARAEAGDVVGDGLEVEAQLDGRRTHGRSARLCRPAGATAGVRLRDVPAELEVEFRPVRLRALRASRTAVARAVPRSVDAARG